MEATAMRARFGNDRKQGGFTIVEMMVAMVLIFIVMGAAYMSVTRESVDADTEEAVVDMQQRARLAVAILAKSIRRMGFLGCDGVVKANTLNSAGSDSSILGSKTSAVNPAAGNADYWDPAAGSIMADMRSMNNVDWLGAPVAFYDDAPVGHPRYLPGTDAISVAWLDGGEPVTPMASSSSDITLASAAFDQDDILVITDCQDYSIFQKTNGPAATIQHLAGVGGAPQNATNDLRKAYGDTSRVYRLNIDTFFVANDANNEPTLYRNNKAPVISGIESVQFQVLIDTNRNGDLTDEAWGDVVSGATGTMGKLVMGGNKYDFDLLGAVRLFVLARTDPIAGYVNRNTYDYPNSPYYSAANPYGSTNGAGGAPNDNRYRYLASATIYMRNLAD